MHRTTHVTVSVLAALATGLVAATPLAASELRVERTNTVIASLQPEDFPPPPGAPIAPLLGDTDLGPWDLARRSTGARERQGCRYRASITNDEGRAGNLSKIRMSTEAFAEPPTERHRWRLTGGLVLCKYRVYLGRGPSLTVVEPTYKDSKTGYYDAVLNTKLPRFSQMTVWAHPAKKR